MIHPETASSILKLSVVLTFVAAIAPAAKANQIVNLYEVGNSLTGIVRFDSFQAMVESRGNQDIWGAHIRGGATLSYISQNPSDYSSVGPSGQWDVALANNTWNAVTLEPFYEPISGSNGSLAALTTLINATRANSPNARIYVYEIYPQLNASHAIDYQTVWNGPSNASNGYTPARDYYNQLMPQIQALYPSQNNPIMMIPFGEVMSTLDQRIRAGLVPGYTDISQLWPADDGIHLNSAGSYLLALTEYATIYREDPHGLSGADPMYNVTDPALETAMQDAVWDTVQSNQYSGVPEPGSLAFLAVGGIYLAGRRRRRFVRKLGSECDTLH